MFIQLLVTFISVVEIIPGELCDWERRVRVGGAYSGRVELLEEDEFSEGVVSGCLVIVVHHLHQLLPQHCDLCHNILCSALTFSWLHSHLTLFLFTLKLPSRTFWQPRSLIEKTLNLIRCKLYNTWKIEHWQVELSKCVVFKFEGSWSNYSVLRHRVFILWICKSSSLDIYLDIWMWNVDTWILYLRRYICLFR